MEVESESGLSQPVTDEIARGALDELLSDSRFRANERGKSILKYIADHYFNGTVDGIKGYTIAIDVLGRCTDFNPSLDPIVRIELSRLRSALRQYYEAYGGELPVIVQVPRGQYTVVFTRNVAASNSDGDESNEEIPEKAPQLAKRRIVSGAKFVTNTILLIAGLFATSLVAANQLNMPAIKPKPRVDLVIDALDDRLRGEASQIRDALSTAITQYQTLNIQSYGTSVGPETGDYSVQMKYFEESNKKNVWWQIKRARTNDVFASGIVSTDYTGRSKPEIRDNLVADLSKSLAASRSPINLFELHQAELDDLGNICVLRAELVMERVTSLNLPQIRTCLKKNLVKNIDDSDSNAALAQVLLYPVRGTGDPDSILRSQELARHAVMVAPNSDRAQIAMMLSQFYSGSVDAAIDTGHRALAMNPYNPTSQGLLAWIMFANGRWEEAVGLAKSGSSIPSVAHTSSALVMAFDAYRKGDWSNAAVLAEQVNSKGDLITALRIAALAQLNSKDAHARLTAAVTDNGNFIQELQARLLYERMAEPVPALLLQGIKKAEKDSIATAAVGAM